MFIMYKGSNGLKRAKYRDGKKTLGSKRALNLFGALAHRHRPFQELTWRKITWKV